MKPNYSEKNDKEPRRVLNENRTVHKGAGAIVSD
jgi:hypothetical protein